MELLFDLIFEVAVAAATAELAHGIADRHGLAGLCASLQVFFAGVLTSAGAPRTLAIAEVAVPTWAERAGATNWHPQHIAERYGPFTIILLGESVLAAITGVRGALEESAIGGAFITI